MQRQYWQPAAPTLGTPAPRTPSQPLFLASRRVAEAREKAPADALEPPQQPRRSARLQHCPPPKLAAAGTPAGAAPAEGRPMSLRLASEDHISAGSLASSRSGFCGSPEEALPRELTPHGAHNDQE